MLTAILLCMSAIAADPTPAPQQRFALPLSDGTTAQAVFLPAPDDAFYLVYPTKSGQLVFMHVIQGDPNPDPVPPDPVPPAKTLHVAVVHDPAKSSALQRQIMCDPSWRDHVPDPHVFEGIYPADHVDPNTGQATEHMAPFLEAAAGHPLPCLVLLNENKKPVAVVPLPDSASGILEQIRKHGGQTTNDPNNRREQLQGTNNLPPGPPRTQTGRISDRMLSQEVWIRLLSSCRQSNRLNNSHSSRGMGRPHQSRPRNLFA